MVTYTLDDKGNGNNVNEDNKNEDVVEKTTTVTKDNASLKTSCTCRGSL